LINTANYLQENLTANVMKLSRRLLICIWKVNMKMKRKVKKYGQNYEQLDMNNYIEMELVILVDTAMTKSLAELEKYEV